MLLEKTINFEKNAFKFFPIQYLGLLVPTAASGAS